MFAANAVRGDRCLARGAVVAAACLVPLAAAFVLVFRLPGQARAGPAPKTRSIPIQGGTVKADPFSRFGGPEVIEIVDLPDPHAGPGQVRIAVRAAGLNASDWKKRQGLMDQELPQTLGYEAAGVVDELGAGGTDVAVGDRVFGLTADEG